MKNRLVPQVVVLTSLAIILGLSNNLRSSIHIPWVKDWIDYDEALVVETPEPPSNQNQTEENAAMDDELAKAEVQQLILENYGIQQINLETAKKIFLYARDMTLWIDARDPEVYEKAHIEGALNLFFYEKAQYIDDVRRAIEAFAPQALVFYCEGKDCADSRFLAEDFLAEGYENIFDFRDGFDDWHMAKLPVTGTQVTQAELEPVEQEATQASAVEDLSRRRSHGMYLEEIVRDLMPFFLGLLLILFWKRSRQSAVSIWAAAIFVGLFFMWAGIPKILNPLVFAKDIWNYDLAPSQLINLTALIMPWLEVLAGFCLIVGVMRRGAGFILGALLILFFVLVSINMIRGHDFNCGCTPSDLLLTDIFVENWNDKITLLLRDFGLFAMVLVGIRKPDNKGAVKWPDPPGS